jgi:hypothetical protein
VRSQVEHLSVALGQFVFGQLKRPALGATLDLDSTVFERYGGQEGSLKGYNPRKHGPLPPSAVGHLGRGLYDYTINRKHAETSSRARPLSETRRRTLFALEFQQLLAKPFAAVLKDQQPRRNLLRRITKSSIEHLFDHRRQIAFERHTADTIITGTRQLALSQYSVGAELPCRTDRMVRRQMDIDAARHASIQPKNPPVSLFVDTLALRAFVPIRSHPKNLLSI